MTKDIQEFRACPNDDEIDFLAKDANRISGKIAQSLSLTSPWINFIDPYFQLRMDSRRLVEAWKILKKYYKKTK